MQDAAPVRRSGFTPAWRVLTIAARDIKLAHSVFALPFALLAAAVVAPRGPGGGVDWPRFAGQLALVCICMVAARTWAMVFNRVADRRFDAENPRTARRAFASGALGREAGLALLAGSAGLFTAACACLWAFYGNPAPLAFAVPVLGWIAFYSYTKRFTALCHVVLGTALALSPVAAAVAVGGLGVLDGAWLWWLAGMVLAWVAGFDVIYALQDLDFDRSRGLRSIPAALGWRGAIWVSRGLHAAAIAAIWIAWAQARAAGLLGPLFGAAVALTALLLLAEHAVLTRRGKAGLEMAFFTINGVVSIVIGCLGIADALS